jgi:transcriptional regulator with XRE-family HTH domain
MLFREWIDKNGLTRSKAAELLNVTAASITYWYHGTHRPSAAMTARIFDISGGLVTVNDLHRAFQMARDA